jgi:hypothetical protein
MAPLSAKRAKSPDGSRSERGAHVLLQVRTRVLNEDLRETFRRWYPGMKADPGPVEDAAA